jgi:WD40 repeat protein
VFPGDDLRVIIAQHLTAQPPDPAALRPDCPPDLASYLLTMLAKEPEQRPGAADAADALPAMRQRGSSPAIGSVRTHTVVVAPRLDPGPAPTNLPMTANPPGTAGSRPGRPVRWLSREKIRPYRAIHVDPQDSGSPQSLAFSPDCRTLASGGKIVQLWDVQEGTSMVACKDQRDTSGISDVAFNHAGTILASTDLDTDAIVLRDVPSGRILARFTGAGAGKDRVAFSPDDSLLAACTQENLGVWEVATGRLIATKPTDAFGSLAFSPDGTILAVGVADRVMLWEVDRLENALHSRLPDLTASMRQASNWGVAFTPDGTLLAAAVSNHKRAGSVYLWSVPDGQLLAKYASSKGLVALAVSPAGDVIATVHDLKSVQLWEVGSGLWTANLDSPATCLAFSPDGRYLAAGGTNEIRVWTSR